MKKLTLPIVKGNIPAAKSLSMNEYLRFVKLHLKYTLDKKVNKRWKSLSAVNVPFFIKD